MLCIEDKQMVLPDYDSFKKAILRLRRNELSVMLMITDAIQNRAELDFTSENLTLLKKSCEALLYVIHRFDTLNGVLTTHFIDGYKELDGHIYIYPNMDLHHLWLKFLQEKKEQEQKLLELEEEERQQELAGAKV